MPLDLNRLLSPDQSALVVLECQRGVVGDLSGLPGLAEQARKGMIPVVAELVAAARAVGVPVIHGTALRRRDGLGANTNARLFRHMERVEHPLHPGSEAAEIVPEIPTAESDLVLPRLHGLSPFQGTELDSILRNSGIATVIGVGVSVNVAVQNFAFDAVNAAYQVVIPRDGVAGFPESYKEAVFEHTLAAITTLVRSEEILDVWRRAATEPTSRQ